MAKITSVDLEIASYSLRAQLEELLASHSEFRLKDWKDSNPPDLLILELLDGEKDKTFAYINDLRRASPDTEVFLTAAQIDVEVLLEVIHAGVSEFLPQPIKPEQVEKALGQYKIRSRQRHQTTPGEQGKIISMIGAKGGVGTTTLAVNFALTLQQVLKDRSNLLMDLNFQDGEIPLFLDMNPEHGLSDLAQKSNFDAVFLQSLISTHPSGMSILPMGSVDADPVPLRADIMGEAGELLGSLFDFLIVDCGQRLGDINRSILERSSSIFVVSTMAAPALRRAKELLDAIRKMDIIGCEVVVVFNRFTSRASPSLQQTEQFLKIKQAKLIPNDYDLACRAINEGKPIVELAPRSRLSKSIRQLAQATLRATQPPSPSALSKLFSVFVQKKKKEKPNAT